MSSRIGTIWSKLKRPRQILDRTRGRICYHAKRALTLTPPTPRSIEGNLSGSYSTRFKIFGSQLSVLPPLMTLPSCVALPTLPLATLTSGRQPRLYTDEDGVKHLLVAMLLPTDYTTECGHLFLKSMFSYNNNLKAIVLTTTIAMTVSQFIVVSTLVTFWCYLGDHTRENIKLVRLLYQVC